MDFIFMLTHHDRTVENCLEVFDDIVDLGLSHIGFKDVGAKPDTLKRLTTRIRDCGAVSYVEVVSTSPASIRQSISAAKDLGVDRVLGGQDVALAISLFGKNGVGYFPFAGRPEGHPTRLGGSPAEVEEDCASVVAEGCPGVDLLAYRAIHAEPLELVKAARKGLGSNGHLIVAGSIDSPDRIRAVEDAGADAFTIGSAIFEESFARGAKGVRAQCEAVLKLLGH